MSSPINSQNQSVADSQGQHSINSHQLKGKNDDCKADLLYAFGISHVVDKAFKSTYAEKKFCSRNASTCCNAKHIESVQDRYIESEKELRKQFQVMEELFSLFVGLAYDQVFYELRNVDKCDYVLTQDNIDKNDFFDEDFIQREIDAIKTLSLNLKGYLNRQLWFFRDLICTVCSPNNHEYFELDDGNSLINVHISTCSDMYEMKDYEAELVRTFADFILPFVKLVNCSSDNTIVSSPIDTETVDEMKQKLDKCFSHSFNIEEEDCKELCEKSLLEYKFPIDIFGTASTAVKAIYEKLTSKSIDDFYQLTRGEEWTDQNLDRSIFFFDPQNAQVKQFGLADVKWKVDATKGVSVYHNEMSKLFTRKNVDLVKVVVVAFIGLLIK